MRVHYLLFILLLVLFQGCSTKQSTLDFTVSQTEETTLPLKSNTQEESDEFEYEYTDTHKNDIFDPLSGYNRVITSFNDTVFTYAVNPISKGYAKITPEPIRKSLSNLIHNIQFPIRFVNNLLQGKFQNTSDELERFIVNSTVGIAGLFDPAAIYMKMPAHNEDFGQTLGHYGIGTGFHIVLPFLGPSNIRDIIGLGVDGYISPLIYQKSLNKYKIPNNHIESVGIYSSQMINKNSLNLGAYETLKKDAIDLYPFLRDVYEQKRTTDIKE